MSPRLLYAVTALFVTTLLLFTIQHTSFINPKPWKGNPTPPPSPAPPSKAIVIGKLASEDTSWVTRELPDWHPFIYSVDNTSAALHTPVNKGREALAYLSYVVEHYAALPETVLFLHAHRDGAERAWHVDNAGHDNVEAVRALRLGYVAREGYVNLRCGVGHAVERAMPSAWTAMFPSDPLPTEIGVPCCAQFAVSKRQILARPRADYARYRAWVLETELEDRVSGRVMEYLWHVIFGRGPVQ
ncbi:hypothetical protein MMC34_000497 [Xylographa carneopallida]|nr:hypothetical protein [Xylographa carneopallida]